MTHLERTYHQNTFLGAKRRATLLMVSCRCVEGTKKNTYINKKERDLTTLPIPPGHAPFWAATIFGMWGRVADVIIFVLAMYS